MLSPVSRLFTVCALSLGLAIAAEPLPVACGTSVVHDLTVRIGGDRVQAEVLAPYGGDPHTFQPTPVQAKALASAKVIVINGLGFEGWFDGLLTESQSTALVIDAAKGIDILMMDGDHACGAHGHDHGHDHEVPDPHAFNSPVEVVRFAENIRDGLISADPAGKAGYEERSAAVVASLRELDGWIKKQVAVIPQPKRVLVTNHDALGYFCRAYGFTVKAPLNGLENAETSPKELAAIIAFIKSEGVKGVFLEYAANDKLIAQIAKESGAKVGGELFIDGIPDPASGIIGYEATIRHNVTTIVDALR
jgi:zinc/manganese transport system substrate-binding protein